MRYLLIGLLLISGCAAKKTTWVGKVAIGTGDQYYSNVGWLVNHELGLRSDGVVVWRKTDEKENEAK